MRRWGQTAGRVGFGARREPRLLVDAVADAGRCGGWLSAGIAGTWCVILILGWLLIH